MRIAVKNIQTFYLVLCLTGCALFVYLATVCYFSDSEIWLLALSKKAMSPGPDHSVYYKWFFHVVVFLTSFWARNNLLVYEIARSVFAGVALSSVFLVAATFSKILQKKHLFLPLVLVCLTSSLFFNQGFRIRADILALFLHALFLFVLFYKQAHGRGLAFLLIIINLALLLTTAKAIIFINLHILVGIYFFIQKNQEHKNLGKKVLISVLAPGTFGLFILSLLAFVMPTHPFLTMLRSAGDFYMKSFEPGLGGAIFFQSYDFMHVVRFLHFSWVHTLLFLGWLTLFFMGIFAKKKESLHSFFHIYCSVLLIQILLYNQKLPFFLGPFLTPVIAWQYASVASFLSSRRLLNWVQPLLISLACWLCWKQFMVNYQFNNNVFQKEFISQLEDYKHTNPQVSIYDVIGLLPLDTTYYAFIGPGDVSQHEVILSYIRAEAPDVYIYTFKNILFGTELRTFLNENYFESAPGVWVKAQHVRTDQELPASTKIISLNQKNYWLVPNKKPHFVYSPILKKDILSECLLLDSRLALSQTDSVWVGVPLEYHRFTIVLLPLPNLKNNPFELFRFDTAF